MRWALNAMRRAGPGAIWSAAFRFQASTKSTLNGTTPVHGGRGREPGQREPGRAQAGLGGLLDVRQLLRALGERYPQLAPHLESGYAIAIDGEIFQDAWFAPIQPDSEVHLVPAIRGG